MKNLTLPWYLACAALKSAIALAVPLLALL
jgi:hypothetical protein